MKLSTKGRYAMVALADLALAEVGPLRGEELTSLAAVAKRQDISLPYLEQLFVKLRRAGLVDAVRGPGGGYRLARSPDAIRISEVMEAVEENVDAMHSGAGASGGVSGTRAQSLTNRLWVPVGQCLRVSAPDPAFGRNPQRNAAVSRSSGAVSRGG